MQSESRQRRNEAFKTVSQNECLEAILLYLIKDDSSGLDEIKRKLDWE